MRIASLISMAEEYFVLGAIGILVLLALVLVVYKFLLKGNKKLKFSRIFGWILLGSYTIIVLGATIFSRASITNNRSILPLFYSYRDAWINFSLTAWRNIILNVCMFVPFGILLPFMIKFFRNFWKTYLAGFLFTLCIEAVQLFQKRGIFELDDILHNTVGMMIGYGIYAFIVMVLKKYKKEKVSWKKVAILQLPLIICVVGFSVIFISYHNKELGNVGGQYIVTYDADKLQVKSNNKYSKEVKKVPVYQFKRWSNEDAADFAENLFQKLGIQLDKDRNDFYEDMAIFYGENQTSLWIYYVDGTYNLSCLFDENDEIKTKFSEEEIRKVFEKYNIIIPEKATFGKEDGIYTFNIDPVMGNNNLTEGEISVKVSEEKEIIELNYGLKQCKMYKKFEGISEQEAFEQICSGQFYYPYGRADKLSIVVKECKMRYEIDSKGYYQPVYLFACEINGEKNEIKIPVVQ